jgi:peptide/nickel transport system permease protein
MVTMLRYIRRNPNLGLGVAIFIFLVLFSIVGSFYTDPKGAYPLAAPANKAPTWDYPFGTDSQGRDLLAVAVAGTWLTLRIGVTAGLIGITIGTILGFIAGFYGGLFDSIIRWTVDVLLTVPGLLVLVVIASSIGAQALSVTQIALIIAMLAWLGPTRTIRSQVLSMRERPYVMMARLNGMSGLGIIFREMIPNLLPYLGASLVASTTGAIFASIGLAALGLGSLRDPTLGVTIYWVMSQNAFVRGMWWWATVPISIVVLIFIMLFLISAGLDELANPRVRRAA